LGVFVRPINPFQKSNPCRHSDERLKQADKILDRIITAQLLDAEVPQLHLDEFEGIDNKGRARQRGTDPKQSL
jgi:hypothetical protein